MSYEEKLELSTAGSLPLAEIDDFGTFERERDEKWQCLSSLVHKEQQSGQLSLYFAATISLSFNGSISV